MTVFLVIAKVLTRVSTDHDALGIFSTLEAACREVILCGGEHAWPTERREPQGDELTRAWWMARREDEFGGFIEFEISERAIR